MSFDDLFEKLTGNPPFPWQQALYERFVADDIPSSCNLPTGLGKTSIIAIWLIALVERPKQIPRRLVYVVNRRTVVDQTTYEVEKYRHQLNEPWLAPLREKLLNLCALPLNAGESPLAISTLRGQFADNREWSADPARPAVICGTVDMIGSRLLFSGYGIGFKSRPLHAGFLGQDALLIHDEAHLEPAFQTLISAVESEQKEERTASTMSLWLPLKTVELTATSRTGNKTESDNTFELSDEDRKTAVVRQRLYAKKSLHLHGIQDEKNVAEKILELTKKFSESNKPIVIFVRKVEDVDKITKQLPTGQYETLTGTMRGYEREGLISSGVFQRFLPQSNRNTKIAPKEGTVYLVCTSAGEVGVNISADHLICDLSTFESMAQRFGRVNRFGERTDTEIHVVHPNTFRDDDDLEPARRKTFELLSKLNGNACPNALGALDPEERQQSFAPAPDIYPTTDILFDAWALTSIRGVLPGRPPVAPYLHGKKADWEPAETYVGWRDEVSKLEPLLNRDFDLFEYENFATELLEDYPLKPLELLRDRSDRVFKQLEQLARRENETHVWLVDSDLKVSVLTLGQITDKNQKERIEGKTVLLPPALGGLRSGRLDASNNQPTNDVSGEWRDENDTPRRWRGWNDETRPPRMKLIREIDLSLEDDANEAIEDIPTEEIPKRIWCWYEAKTGDNEFSRWSTENIWWKDHVSDVVEAATAIAKQVSVSNELATAVRLSAKFHDDGKLRKRMQHIIFGNRDYVDAGTALAKSARNQVNVKLPEKYRHELGSLVDLQLTQENEFVDLSEELQDVVRHLVACHHGRGRPHFVHDEIYDPEPKGIDVEQIAAEIPRRFVRLQKTFGRWGLAYLESLLRAADWAASANPSSEAAETLEVQ